jgi:NAD(P)-dependent dehydrogenase (short-subunit alcohol dehydrogenase family)
VVLLQADLLDMQAVRQLAAQAIAAFGRLDGLVNNASSFFPPKSARSTSGLARPDGQQPQGPAVSQPGGGPGLAP